MSTPQQNAFKFLRRIFMALCIFIKLQPDNATERNISNKKYLSICSY